MDAEDTLRDDAGTLKFREDVESLLLDAFAKGATVEGTWDVGSDTKTIPGWTIKIAKSAGADPDHDPTVIE